MCSLQIISAVILVLVSNISLLSTESTEVVEESSVETPFISEASDTPAIRSKQPRTEADELRESRAKWKPLEGSHYDENYHVVIDDPEVYQKALEKEKAKRKPLYPESSPQQKERGPLEIFYRVYKRNPVLGVLFFIAVAIVAIILLNIRDSLKKSKK